MARSAGLGTHKPQRLRNFGYPPPRWEAPDALARPGAGSGQVAYATSKLANVQARDRAAAAGLWTASERLVGLA